MAGLSDRDSDSTESGRVDDQFRALLEGLRTSLPGVQVLFAFLLTAPLQSGFSDLTSMEKLSFSVAFFASGSASILLIAPSVHQRLRAPASGIERHSQRHLAIATWVTIAGTIAMGIAIVSTALLVSSIVFGNPMASIAAIILATLLVWAWFYLPLVSFRHDTSSGR